MTHLPATPFAQPDLSHAAVTSMRTLALRLLMLESSQEKADQVRGTDTNQLVLDTQECFSEPEGVPGRPLRPLLVQPALLMKRAVGTPKGRAGLVHALAHIEANAINLALDAIWRFPGLPEDFYRDWWCVAQEEALHFELLNAHLVKMGFVYGDFPAHDGLWTVAKCTNDDVLARMALVPRTLEARGLDATPAVRNRLVSVGDTAGAEILDVILRDEIGHVAIGNHWFHWLCEVRKLEPVATYKHLLQSYRAQIPQGPFNMDARRKAGFTEAELTALTSA